MKCDYYIQNELVINYKCKYGKIKTIYTNRTVKKGYYSEQDSHRKICIDYKNINTEMDVGLQKNTYNKMLYENENWVKESYKKKYGKYISKTYKEDILKIIKVFKKNTAFENITNSF
jgi:hypothetical protein